MARQKILPCASTAQQVHRRIRESSWVLGRWDGFVHSVAVAEAKLQLVRALRRIQRPGTVLPNSAGKSAQREQVAAICYRIHDLRIEFLLVRTRKGRWTFPKGGVVEGLTRAQSAAVEAFEEGGVHGRIEGDSFTRYKVRKRGTTQSSGGVEIYAHLCQVLRLGPPAESNRTPTWFSPENAELRLKRRRTRHDARELARVLDLAVNRIVRMADKKTSNPDPLQRVYFEASEAFRNRLITRVAVMPYVCGKRDERKDCSIIEFPTQPRKVLRLGPG